MVSDVDHHRMIASTSSRCDGSYFGVGYPRDASTCYVVDFDGDCGSGRSKIGASEGGLNTFGVSWIGCNAGDGRWGIRHQFVRHLGVAYAIRSGDINLEIFTNSSW